MPVLRLFSLNESAGRIGFEKQGALQVELEKPYDLNTET